jgi:hypothetical protein
MLTGK